jgi:16S rRNA (cytosine967-C5)-methyltransferase
MKSYREHVLEIIDRFYTTSQNLKSLQNYQFNEYNLISSDINRIIVETREILRWKGRIDWYIKKHLKFPFNKLHLKLLEILELGTYEILFDNKVPNYAAINSSVEIAKAILNRKASSLVNAVLRKISTENFNEKANDIEEFNWYSYPKWLFEKWTIQFGIAESTQLYNYFNDSPPLIIRRNSNKIDHGEFLNVIPQESSIKLLESSNIFYEVVTGGSELKKSNSFKNGYFSFQDRAAGMIAEVLDPHPNEIILDVCCAPGTKTNYISELMGNKGKIIASDVDEQRVDLAKNDSVRLDAVNIDYQIRDAVKDEFPMADKVLIDAPCTGTGTIGRRPDIKWRRKPTHLEKIVKLQRSILNNVSQFVKPGGVLVYATCTMEDEENWQVVEAFLKLNGDFKVVSIQDPRLSDFIDEKGCLKTFPPIHKMDGMFAVKMLKNERKNY